MKVNSKIRSVETLACDAGWRNYHFVKLTTDDGIVGWSEFDEGFGSPGVGAVIERLAATRRRPDGRRSRAHLCRALLRHAARPPAASSRRRIGAIENALLDAKAKALGVPCYELLGGKVRDRIRVYWSHCATWRINHPTYYKPAITDLDGVKAIGREVREKGFTALQDQHLHLRGRARTRRAGARASARRSIPSSTSTGTCCATCACTSRRMRDGAGPDVDLLLDLNFNAKTEGYLKILRAIADIDMFWIEIDTYQPRGARLHPPPEPASDLVVRDAARPARVPALLPRAGDGRGDHRHAVERRVAVDEDRRVAPRRTRSTSRRIISTATSAP